MQLFRVGRGSSRGPLQRQLLQRQLQVPMQMHLQVTGVGATGRGGAFRALSSSDGSSPPPPPPPPPPPKKTPRKKKEETEGTKDEAPPPSSTSVSSTATTTTSSLAPIHQAPFEASFMKVAEASIPVFPGAVLNVLIPTDDTDTLRRCAKMVFGGEDPDVVLFYPNVEGAGLHVRVRPKMELLCEDATGRHIVYVMQPPSTGMANGDFIMGLLGSTLRKNVAEEIVINSLDHAEREIFSSNLLKVRKCKVTVEGKGIVDKLSALEHAPQKMLVKPRGTDPYRGDVEEARVSKLLQTVWTEIFQGSVPMPVQHEFAWLKIYEVLAYAMPVDMYSELVHNFLTELDPVKRLEHIYVRINKLKMARDFHAKLTQDFHNDVRDRMSMQLAYDHFVRTGVELRKNGLLEQALNDLGNKADSGSATGGGGLNGGRAGGANGGGGGGGNGGPGSGANSGSSEPLSHHARFKKRLQEFEQAAGTGAAAAAPKQDEEAKEREFWKAQLQGGGKPLSMPLRVKKIVDEELPKLQGMGQNLSAEGNTTRNYLDWLTAVPWGRTTAASYDVDFAEHVLNEDHYGMDEVKKVILELVAVSKLKQDIPKSKILCLVGPPGVGKTSIGMSIARALNRKFYRFSVGGLYDASEIKGHRRTYIGAMPGKLVQMFKTTGCVNPLMMIDEVDKLGFSHGAHQGNLSHSLLELLDPSQNGSFVDHYMDVGIDASQVLFVCTANSTHTIPGPLLDRLEMVHLSGYDAVEKVQIAKKYLEPKLHQDTGLGPEFTGLTPEATEMLAKMYSRESGVRNMQKLMEKIYRKVAHELVREKKQVTQVEAKDLEYYLGKPKYAKENIFETPIPGVVRGLAYSENGGSTLFIEAKSTTRSTSSSSSSSAGKEDEHTNSNNSNSKREFRVGNIRSSGNLGETMRESVILAYENARAASPGSDFFERNEIHLHVPAGGTPKDGPSAGITMALCLVSLARQQPVIPALAMTGEVSLTGLVLPVGGIREKLLAAARENVKTIILPEQNIADYEKLPEHLRKNFDHVHFVKRFSEVLDIALPKDKPAGDGGGQPNAIERNAAEEPTLHV